MGNRTFKSILTRMVEKKKVTHTQCARQPLIWNCYRIDGVSVTLKTSGWKEHREKKWTTNDRLNWECFNGKRSKKKSIFMFGTNTQWMSGRWKSDSCSNKINGRLMIYQHQNQQTEEAFKCLTLTHNIFSGVKNNNNNKGRIWVWI